MSVSLLSYAITSLENVKAFLEISNNTSDEQLKRLINVVTEFIESQTSRRIKETVYTNELLSGEGTPILKLHALPVSSSAGFSLQYKSNPTSSWGTVNRDTYEVDYKTGLVHSLSGNFDKGVNNYRVSYTGGYSTVPADLEYASWKLIKKAFDNRKQSGGISSQTLGNYSVTFTKVAFQDTEVSEILSQYRAYDV